MNKLQTIVKQTLLEIEKSKAEVSIARLQKTEFFKRKCFSLTAEIVKKKKQNQNQNQNVIIAEFKRKSPSKGVIKANADLLQITQSYQNCGAAAISILTNPFFDGNNLDIELVREEIKIPILRKEFMVDEYQIYQAKAIGADVILLIASCLTQNECKNFAKLAQQLGLEVLLEIHNSDELQFCNPYIDVLGVNNRNLKTFEVDINQSIQLFSEIAELKKEGLINPNLFVISESGIDNLEQIKQLTQVGFDGFLMGESLMKSDYLDENLKKLIFI